MGQLYNQTEPEPIVLAYQNMESYSYDRMDRLIHAKVVRNLKPTSQNLIDQTYRL